MIKLVIRLRDGQELSGTYSYVDALSRLRAAVKEPEFFDFDFQAAR